MVGGEPVVLALTRAQVDHVVRAAASTDGIARLLSDRSVLRRVFEAVSGGLLEDPHLSRSLLNGLWVLAGLGGEALSVTEAATRAGMSASTTHRYLSTLLVAGLVEQDPKSRLYRSALAAAAGDSA